MLYLIVYTIILMLIVTRLSYNIVFINYLYVTDIFYVQIVIFILYYYMLYINNDILIMYIY